MRERDWLIPVMAVLAIQLALWSVIYATGSVTQPTVRAHLTFAYAALIVVFLCKALVLVLAMRREGRDNPASYLLGRAWTSLPRGLVILAAANLLVIGWTTFASLKAGIPQVVPFWLDPPLAWFERAVLGAHPFEITHAVLGFATPLIDAGYATFLPVFLASLLWILCAAPSVLRSQALVTVALTWLLLGVVCAYAFSSVGPIFYDRAFGGTEFGRLNAIIESQAWFASQAERMLWEAYSAGTVLSLNGISAMPSMHVALTFWMVLCARGTRLGTAAWAYYAFTWFGSVHLGWHYVADGLISTAGVLLLWKLVPCLLPKAALPATAEYGCAARRRPFARPAGRP